MTKTKSKKPAGKSPVRWEEANWTYLELALRRLRLLLQRRVLWLRKQWKHDPLQEYQGLVISDAHADWLLAGEDFQAEDQFYEEDKGAVNITRSIHKFENAIADQKKALEKTGQPLALTVLAQIFGLSPFDQDVLLMCLAPELDPTFERLYAYVQDDVTRKYATPYLALALFRGTNTQTDHNSFLPTAPLRYYRMISLEAGHQQAGITFTRPLSIDERITHYIRGINYMDETVQQVIHSSFGSTLPFTHNHHVVENLVQRVRLSLKNGSWPCINLIGLPDNGQKAMAHELCNTLGLRPISLNTEKLPTGLSERQELIRLLGREALLSRFALYIDTFDADISEKNLTSTMNDLIEGMGTMVIIASKDRWHTKRESLVLHIPEIESQTRKTLWESALSDAPIDKPEDILDEIVQQFEFGPEAIVSVSADAKNQMQPDTKGKKHHIPAEILWTACREYMTVSMEELAHRIISTYAWDDLVLPDDTKRQLQEISDQVVNRATVYSKWEFGKYLTRGRGITALFSGPSGTGKTMAAEILSNHNNNHSSRKLNLYRIDLANVVNKYIGVTEKNLKKVFDAAETSGAILFFDEADALFGKRTEIRDSHDRYANLEVNYLLQRMEDYRGLAILATNNKTALDHAFLRRIRFIVNFPFPDAANRQLIWEKAFPEKVPLNGLEHSALARLEIPGGNIKNIVVNAAFLAAEEGKPIDMPKIMHAARREYKKIDKLISESEFGKYYHLVKA